MKLHYLITAGTYTYKGVSRKSSYTNKHAVSQWDKQKFMYYDLL